MSAPLESPVTAGGDQRIARAAVTLLVGVPVAIVVALLSFAGDPSGWVPTAGLLAAVGVVAAWLAASSVARRIVLAAALATLLAPLGVRVAESAPPTTKTLNRTLDQFVQPGWRLERSSQWGNLLCFDECRAASRTYVIHGDLAHVLADLGPRLESAGFVDRAVDETYGRYQRDRPGHRYLVTVRSRSNDVTHVELQVRL